MCKIVDAVKRSLVDANLAEGARVGVGFSGGLDSTVLLHAAKIASSDMKMELLSIHVNHGLSVNAGDWEEHCRQVSNSLGVVFVSKKADGLNAAIPDLENACREKRYGIYAEIGVDFVLLGHHADDQAETVLFRLGRGSGLKGLSGMPKRRRIADGVWLSRPLLDFSRSDLSEYANFWGLSFVTDESNDDLRFSRNRIRHRVLPELRQVVPHFSQGIRSSLKRLAESESLLAEVGCEDLDRSRRDGFLSLSELSKLSSSRLRNALKMLLVSKSIYESSESKLDEMETMVRRGSGEMRFPAVKLRAWNDGLFIDEKLVDASKEERTEVVVGESAYGIDWESSPGFRKGVALFLSVPPAGSSFLKGGVRRSLSDVFRLSKIPPWSRKSMPTLLDESGEILWVGGVGFSDAANVVQEGFAPVMRMESFVRV